MYMSIQSSVWHSWGLHTDHMSRIPVLKYVWLQNRNSSRSVVQFWNSTFIPNLYYENISLIPQNAQIHFLGLEHWRNLVLSQIAHVYCRGRQGRGKNWSKGLEGGWLGDNEIVDKTLFVTVKCEWLFNCCISISNAAERSSKHTLCYSLTVLLFTIASSSDTLSGQHGIVYEFDTEISANWPKVRKFYERTFSSNLWGDRKLFIVKFDTAQVFSSNLVVFMLHFCTALFS